MDIIRFINSKDIGNHLKKIQYDFNSLEAAWLVYQCRDATMKEKHIAWENIIEQKSDCIIPERNNTAPQKSLHNALRKYLEFESEQIELFRNSINVEKGKPYYYQFELIEEDYSEEYPIPFSHFPSLSEIKIDPEVQCLLCHKKQIDSDFLMTVKYTRELEPISIEKPIIDGEETNNLYYYFFDGLWFDFPTPFSKGDIVTLCYKNEPLVLTDVNLGRISSKKIRNNIINNGDTTDMCYEGYIIDDNGIFLDCNWNYMDLEYYNSELSDSFRLLIPLSNYIKGKISLDLYSKAYNVITYENHLKELKPLGFTKEGLVLAGLEQAEQVKIYIDSTEKAPDGYHLCKSIEEAKNTILECEINGITISEIGTGKLFENICETLNLIDWLASRNTLYPVTIKSNNEIYKKKLKKAIEDYWQKKNL